MTELADWPSNGDTMRARLRAIGCEVVLLEEQGPRDRVLSSHRSRGEAGDRLADLLAGPHDCDRCGLPIALSETVDRCTPDTRSLHAECCDECEDS